MERRRFLGTTAAAGAFGGLLLPAPAAPRAVRASVRAARQNPGAVRLSSNENPLGISPGARQAILENLGQANRYPGSARAALLDALAAKHGVTRQHIQLGAGSTDILRLCVQATPAGAAIVTADPTYEDVGRFAQATGHHLTAVPLTAAGAHDLPRMRQAAGSGPAMVFICNPNNPTGTLTSCGEIEAWIAQAGERVIFVVDEAYVEFVEDASYRSVVPLIAARPNLIAVRTFSKIHAMAGLRLGYAVAQPATITRLRAWQFPNNANALVLAAALASLGDAAHQERSLASNRAARRTLLAVLQELGLEALPSHTNFVMHRVPGDLTVYNTRMAEAGFLVGRPFPPMTSWSRVSLGLPDEMTRFAETLRGFRRRGWV